jgi:SAM-dependent methyltransferase
MHFKKIRDILFHNRFTNYSDFRLKEFVKVVSRKVKQNQSILDAGAGECRYKSYFKHANYVSQDLCIGDASWDFSEVDIISEIYAIPVKSGSFENILCMEVMEHLKYPDLAFKEFNRILKPGGKLFMVCPLTWQEHQTPYDYFRYTRYALKMLAEDNGFKIKEIQPMGGRFLVLSQIIIEIFNLSFASLFRKKYLKYVAFVYGIILYPFIFTLVLCLYFLDKTDKDRFLTMQYECVFVRR